MIAESHARPEPVKRISPLAELQAAGLEPALTPAAARAALGGISRATEFRWNREGILEPFHIGSRKLYRADHIRSLIGGLE